MQQSKMNNQSLSVPNRHRDHLHPRGARGSAGTQAIETAHGSHPNTSPAAWGTELAHKGEQESTRLMG